MFLANNLATQLTGLRRAVRNIFGPTVSDWIERLVTFAKMSTISKPAECPTMQPVGGIHTTDEAAWPREVASGSPAGAFNQRTWGPHQTEPTAADYTPAS